MRGCWVDGWFPLETRGEPVSRGDVARPKDSQPKLYSVTSALGCPL